MSLNLSFFKEKLRSWLPQAQAELKAQAADLEAKVRQKNLEPLPRGQISALRKSIANLSVPDIYRRSLQPKIAEAIGSWARKSATVDNSLVVLGSPVEPFTKIFDAILAEWEPYQNLQLKSISWCNRPREYSTLKSQLKSEIDHLLEKNEDQESRLVVVIPDLTCCFLRCVDGLDAIEYLQERLFQDPSVFWLIGCNTWAWQYFNVVSGFNYYFPQTLDLPELEAKELKGWLAPFQERVESNLSYNQQLPEQEQDKQKEDDWDSSSQQDYFEHLADISLGMSYVACQLWLLSLGMKEEEDEEENQSRKILLQKIALPDLPSLDKDDRYLLFSLGLHGQMSLDELAISLADEKIKVQNRVQALYHDDVIKREQNRLKINPAYYLQVKRDIGNNNFPIDGDK